MTVLISWSSCEIALSERAGASVEVRLLLLAVIVRLEELISDRYEFERDTKVSLRDGREDDGSW